MFDIKQANERVRDDFACEHTEQQTVKFIKSNGLPAVVRQCIRCGQTTTSQLKQEGYDLAALPLRDDELYERWWKARQVRMQENYQLHNDAWKSIQEQSDIDWQRRYAIYRQTEHWQRLKRRVFIRDGFICQNCFRKLNSATAVCHHTDYRGFNETGHSFAFECVTLCDNCHADRHPQSGG